MADVTLSITTQSDTKALAETTAQLGNVARATEQVSGGMSKMGNALVKAQAAVYLATSAIRAAGAALRFVNESVARVSRFGDLAVMTGESAARLVILERALQKTGRSAADIPRIFARIATGAEQAKTANSEAAATFARLGLSAEGFSRLAPTAQIEALQGAFTRLQTPAEKAATAIRLFGETGTELLPLLTDSGALNAAATEVGSYAATVERSVRPSKALEETMLLVNTRMAEARLLIAEQMLPLLKRFADTLAAVPAETLARALTAAAVAAGTFSTALAASRLHGLGATISAVIMGLRAKALAWRGVATEATAAAVAQTAAANAGGGAMAARGRGVGGGGLVIAGSLASAGLSYMAQSAPEGGATQYGLNLGSNVASGASIGAAIGSIVPALGTAVGAAVGAAIAGLGTVTINAVTAEVNARETTRKQTETFASRARAVGDTSSIASWDDLGKKREELMVLRRQLEKEEAFAASHSVARWKESAAEMRKAYEAADKALGSVGQRDIWAGAKRKEAAQRLLDIAEAAKLTAGPVAELRRSFAALNDVLAGNTLDSVADIEAATGRLAASITGLKGIEHDPEQLAASLKSQMARLQEQAAGGNLDAARNLETLNSSGAVENTARLVAAHRQADQRERAKEQADNLSGLKAGANVELHTLREALDKKTIEWAHYEERVRAIQRRIHAAEAEAGHVSRAEQATRELERLTLDTELRREKEKRATPAHAADRAGTAPAHADSLTRIGGALTQYGARGISESIATSLSRRATNALEKYLPFLQLIANDRTKPAIGLFG
jgi:hypothetical protein